MASSDSLVKLKSGKTVALRSREEATREAAESSFAEWNMEGRLLYFGHLCWLLQETLWILLLSYPAFVFGALSSILVAVVVWRRRDGGISGHLYHEAKAEVMVNVIHVSWLSSSFINCIADLAFDSRDDAETPGYARGFVNLCSGDAESCADTYDALIVVVRVGFCATVGLWVVSCCYLMYLWVTPPRFVAQGYAFQTCLLEGGWISFWVLADFASSFGHDGFPYAIAAYSVHFVLLVSSMVVGSSRSKITLWDGLDPSEMEALGNVFCRVDLVILSYIVWSLSSLAWMISEQGLEGDEGWRYAAAGTTGVSVALFLAGYKQAMQRGLVLLALKEYDALPRTKVVPDVVVIGQTDANPQGAAL